MKKETVICPKCKKPVEAKDYFSSNGISDWRVESIGVKIVCSKCDYSGLPISINKHKAEERLHD